MSSYLVLARKYRPQTFNDLVGQEQVSRTLQNALTTGRVAHAYLFSGPRGVGKTTAARLLAMALSCLADDIGQRPCGKCQNCLEIQSGQAVDVIEVDGASNRGIDDIRDLRETVKYLPAKSRYKVYIIDEVHALTGNAFNALLKTLEEPPAHVVFIFATTETHKVLPTILSRCQRYDFRRIRVEDITRRLKEVAEMEKIEADPAALEVIARQAEGGLRDSLSLMDQIIAAGSGQITLEIVENALGLIDQKIVRGVVAQTLGGAAPAALHLLAEAYLKGYDFKDLGLKILEHIRALALIKVSFENAQFLDLTEAEEKYLKQTASEFSLENINQHFDVWLKFQNDLQRHPQPRWLMEAQIIRLSQMAPMIPLTELAGRLEKLLAQNPPPRPQAQLGQATPQRMQASEYSAPATPQQIKETLAVTPVPTTEPPLTAINSWPLFWQNFAKKLDNASQALLKDCNADIFSPSQVIIRFKKPIIIGDFIKKNLQAALSPLLKAALGQEPTIDFLVPEKAASSAESEDDRSWSLNKLKLLKEEPEIKTLMERLPGDFVEYRPVAPDLEEEDEEPGALDANSADESAEIPLETEEDE